MKICERCQEKFNCGMNSASQSCWCQSLPPVSLKTEAFKDCLCPKCLFIFVGKAGESFVAQRGHEYGVFHLLASLSGSLVDVLSAAGFDESTVEHLKWIGAIYHQHERVTEDFTKVVEIGDYLRVHSKPRRYPISLVDGFHAMSNFIIFENSDFLIINKPSGIPVHATVDNIRENLLYHLKTSRDVNLRITHRLDTATEGLIVFAKHHGFQKSFNQYLTDGKVNKTYRAFLQRKNPRREIIAGERWIHFMEPSPRGPKKLTSDVEEGWQKCVLNILGSEFISDELIAVTLRLETGRTHQIRAQMSFEGYPLVGDTLYGSTWKTSENFEEIALQSYCVSFPQDFSFHAKEKEWNISSYQSI